MKKIACTGAQGTGKTTLAYKLLDRYQLENPKLRVSILPEVARTCPFPINMDTTVSSQRWIYHQQMVSEIEASEQYDIVICDRTILDNLAYSRNMAVKKDHAFEAIVHDYLDIAVGWMATYDEIYFLRPRFELVDDGIRSIDVDFQKDIDMILDVWIRKYKIKIIELKRGEVKCMNPESTKTCA